MWMLRESISLTELSAEDTSNTALHTKRRSGTLAESNCKFWELDETDISGFTVVLNSFARQHFQARSRREARCRLVKPDMSVSSNSQNLQFDSASVPDRLFVCSAVLLVSSADSSVRDMDSRSIHIYVVKKILTHEAVKTLRMLRRETQVFVEIESHNFRKIDADLFMCAHEFFVQPDHRASRC